MITVEAISEQISEQISELGVLPGGIEFAIMGIDAVPNG